MMVGWVKVVDSGNIGLVEVDTGGGVDHEILHV